MAHIALAIVDAHLGKAALPHLSQIPNALPMLVFVV
jgi:hypothetical protein